MNQHIKTTRTTPLPFAPVPKASQSHQLTTEEKAALWDEAAAYHREAREAQLEIDRLRFKQLSNRGKVDALFERGMGSQDSRNVPLGTCHGCGFENCICERIG